MKPLLSVADCREAYRLLDLVNAEFQSDPESRKHFPPVLVDDTDAWVKRNRVLFDNADTVLLSGSEASEAIELLAIINSRFQLRPLSVACFDLSIVGGVKLWVQRIRSAGSGR